MVEVAMPEPDTHTKMLSDSPEESESILVWAELFLELVDLLRECGALEEDGREVTEAGT